MLGKTHVHRKNVDLVK